MLMKETDYLIERGSGWILKYFDNTIAIYIESERERNTVASRVLRPQNWNNHGIYVSRLKLVSSKFRFHKF